ncbi:MAG TPA: hypothetical protein VNH11_10690 [Pirellulales bacterium]|nr:hypothetical protein [Pirellulales bacterium]
MSEETNYSRIEERLQAEAGRLLIADSRPAAQLLNEYQCRRRRSVQKRLAATAIASAAAAAVMFGWRSGEEGPLPPSYRPATEAIRQDNETAAARQADVQAPAPLPSSMTVEARGALPAIPFVIGDPDSGEPIVKGFYVPEQVEPIDMRDLSPAEREAVRAVLGIEEEIENGDII